MQWKNYRRGPRKTGAAKGLGKNESSNRKDVRERVAFRHSGRAKTDEIGKGGRGRADREKGGGRKRIYRRTLTGEIGQ